jgi:acyl-homoserine lactone acylase PvdQ
MRGRAGPVALLAAGAALLLALPLGAAAPRLPAPADYAVRSLSILVPGESGSLAGGANTRDQAALYDALTPLRGTVRETTLTRVFKPAPLGLGGAKPASVERPRAGVTVARDRFGVAHVFGATQADVAFGAGWVTAADRWPLLALMRGPGRVAALDVPGLDPLALAVSGRTFVPSAQTEAYLANQLDALEASGATGRRISGLVDAYVQGLEAYRRRHALPGPAFTAEDVVAAAALASERFGANGGQEARNAMFLSALTRELGQEQGTAVFRDLREGADPESPVTVPGTFPYEQPVPEAPGSVVLDDASFAGGLPAPPAAASNALLVGAKRSRSGHPLLVAGPQAGYFFPALFAEIDLEGAGFSARGALFPGLPFVLAGRGPDFAWSVTSSEADTIDTFVETLCGDDGHHYVFRGRCIAMQRFDAGVLREPGKPDAPVSFWETTHGPVAGTATVGGTRVAVSLQRATRGRELLSARGFYDLDTGAVRSPQTFLAAAGRVELALDWFYADDRHIAFLSGGRLPLRAPGTDPALPTAGDGDHEWQGFLSAAAHPQAVDPPSGAIVSWNNRPAAGVGAGDSNFSYGSVQRVDLLTAKVARVRLHTLPTLVGAMNQAATQDLRVVRVWPLVRAVLDSGPPPADARARDAAALVDRWLAAGGSRLDADGDGKIDAAGAAVLDAAWPRIADAVLSPVLGPLLPRLAALIPRSDDAGPVGSAYQEGWYGYVEKDLRALLGRPVRAPFATRFCGAGTLSACRDALWSAIGAAADELAVAQSADPAAWRTSAAAERIAFVSPLVGGTLRWTNRPTFQEAVELRGHR